MAEWTPRGSRIWSGASDTKAMAQEFNAYHPPTHPTNQPTNHHHHHHHSLTHHHHSDLLKDIKGVEEGSGGQNKLCQNLTNFLVGVSPRLKKEKNKKWHSGPTQSLEKTEKNERHLWQGASEQRLWHKSLMLTTHPPNQPTNQPPPPPPSSSSLTHSPPPTQIY